MTIAHFELLGRITKVFNRCVDISTEPSSSTSQNPNCRPLIQSSLLLLEQLLGKQVNLEGSYQEDLGLNDIYIAHVTEFERLGGFGLISKLRAECFDEENSAA